MDDFNINALTESRNEYSALFINKLTPCIMQGIQSIFNEACDLCIQNDEDEKYLMTFQNFLGRVTKWNTDIITRETERIIKESNCSYLEDLLTCIHVNQLKILTNVRVGTTQKKVSIDIPKLDLFIHKCYIEVARKLYKSVFLYDRSTIPLMRQKNMREIELIIKECILNVVRDNMPIEEILKSYLEEGREDVADEEKTEMKEVEEEVVDEPVRDISENLNSNTNSHLEQKKELESNQKLEITTPVNTPSPNNLKFNDKDAIVKYDGDSESASISTTPITQHNAPKNIDRLEKLSDERNRERKESESDDDSDDEEEFGEKLNILDDGNVKLDVEKIEPKGIKLKDDLVLDDIEVLV
tara:strand:+ start:2942 stop:4009 length:1068 start_codon:yes stop_codon:yes gene_type:complete